MADVNNDNDAGCAKEQNISPGHGVATGRYRAALTNVPADESLLALKTDLVGGNLDALERSWVLMLLDAGVDVALMLLLLPLFNEYSYVAMLPFLHPATRTATRTRGMHKTQRSAWAPATAAIMIRKTMTTASSSSEEDSNNVNNSISNNNNKETKRWGLYFRGTLIPARYGYQTGNATEATNDRSLEKQIP
jgi:hypothetical protein